MSYRKLSVCVVVLILTAVGVAVAGDGGTALGEPLQGATAVSLGDLLSKPEEFVGKSIRVEGRIDDVCSKAGCWVDIADDAAHKIRFKVQDGVIVFPTESKGKNVVAEGVFTKIEMTQDEAVSWAKHLAEERGEEFDAKTTEVVLAFYRIDGRGAVIH